MDLLELEEMSPEKRIALANCAVEIRTPLAVYFALDNRLSNLVAKTSEPMLAQMRLAWWRDQFERDPEQRPAGDAVLDAVSDYWQGRESALVPLVDAWEMMAVEENLDAAAIAKFAAARGRPVSCLLDFNEKRENDRINTAVTRWALADAALHTSPGQERDKMIEVGLSLGSSSAKLPRRFRGIAILDGLSLRALKRGGRPLMEGRGAALSALRIGLFGR